MTLSKNVEVSFHFFGKIRLFKFSILSKFQNLDFEGKKTKILVKILLKGTNTLFSAKIRKLSFSKPCQGVRNYESMNSQTILDINYVDF